MHICFIGGKSYAGEVKTKKSDSRRAALKAHLGKKG